MAALSHSQEIITSVSPSLPWSHWEQKEQIYLSGKQRWERLVTNTLSVESRVGGWGTLTAVIWTCSSQLVFLCSAMSTKPEDHSTCSCYLVYVAFSAFVSAQKEAGLCWEGGEDAAGLGSAAGSVWETGTAGTQAADPAGERTGISADAAGTHCFPVPFEVSCRIVHYTPPHT